MAEFDEFIYGVWHKQLTGLFEKAPRSKSKLFDTKIYKNNVCIKKEMNFKRSVNEPTHIEMRQREGGRDDERLRQAG